MMPVNLPRMTCASVTGAVISVSIVPVLNSSDEAPHRQQRNREDQQPRHVVKQRPHRGLVARHQHVVQEEVAGDSRNPAPTT